MWLLDKTGIKRKTKQTAAALRRAFEDAGNRRTVTESDRQILQKIHAHLLPAMNPYARTCWAKIICEELCRHFHLHPEHPHSDQPLFFVSLVHTDCMTHIDESEIEISKFKDVLRRGLPGLSYLGMVEPALYVNVSKEADTSGKRAASWHLHAIVWGCTRQEIQKRFKRLNDEGWYRPIVHGLRGADWGQINEGDLGTPLGYMLEVPCNEYRVGKYKEERVTADGELVPRFKSNKSLARKGNLIKLFHLMKGLYLDELIVGGGEGSSMVRRTKCRARARLRPQSPMPKNGIRTRIKSFRGRRI